jgi:hypothetical protein
LPHIENKTNKKEKISYTREEKLLPQQQRTELITSHR